jgi:hypothetical protein
LAIAAKCSTFAEWHRNRPGNLITSADGAFSEQRSEVRAELSRSVGSKLDSTVGAWRLCTNPERPVQMYHVTIS